DGTMLIELRGNSGHTVWPPSTHQETGELVCWERFTDRAEVELSTLKRVANEIAAATPIARHWPAKGSRDTAALALSGALSRAGWDPAQVDKFIFAVATAAGDEQATKRGKNALSTAANQKEGKSTFGWLKLAEVIGKDVVTKACQWLEIGNKSPASPKRIRTIDPYKRFPVFCLPSPLDEFVEQGAAALGCDASYLALPVLSVVASAIGNTRV